VHRQQPEGSARNVWPARVVDLEADRDRVRVELAARVVPGGPAGPAGNEPATVVAEVTPAAVADLGLTPGVEVWATVKAVDVAVYER
jgi:molybdate transport system ATP-binding protein